MTYDEYKTQLDKIVENPDSAATAVLDILENIKADTETLATLEANIAEKDSRIRDLQDVNMKLFLRQSGEPEKKDDEPDVDEMDFQEYLDYLDKEEK